MTQPQQGYWPPPGAYPPPPPGWRPTPPPAPLSPAGQPLADFGTRLLAVLIDGAILFAVASIVALPVVFAFVYSRLDELTDPYAPVEADYFLTEFFWPFLLLELGLIVLMLAAYYVYYVEMMYRSGQTLGKRLMKIRVVPAQPGRRLTRGMAAKRYLVENVGGTLVPFLFYLDGLWQLWDKPYQQTLHDKFAQTVVVKVAA